MKKTIIVFGLIAGVIVSTFMSFTMIRCKNSGGDMSDGMVLGFGAMLLAFAFIFVGIKSFRDRNNNGVISFKKAFLIGLGISFIATILYTVTWAVIYKTVYPNFMDDYFKYSLQEMTKAGKSASEIAKATAEMQKGAEVYSTWYGFTAYTIMEIFPIGLLVSLVAALIMKKKNQGEQKNILHTA